MTFDVETIFRMLATQDVPGLVAFLVWTLVATAKKVSPAKWERIPYQARFLVPSLLAMGSAFALALYNGHGWEAAAFRGLASGVVEALLSSGLHGMLKASPAPYGNPKP